MIKLRSINRKVGLKIWLAQFNYKKFHKNLNFTKFNCQTEWKNEFFFASKGSSSSKGS